MDRFPADSTPIERGGAMNACVSEPNMAAAAVYQVRLMAVVFAALLATSALAQYGYPYGYPFGYPFGYDQSAQMYGAPQAGYGMDPMAQMDLIGQQLQAQMAFYEQQLAMYEQQAQAQIAEINQYFIRLYRETTGDHTSSDEVALYYGRILHCQAYPVDCQIAAQNSAESAAALAANNAAFQQRMAQQNAAWDARNQAWWADQAAQEAANRAWLDSVILGVGDYSSGSGGPTYQLPFAPSQGSWYQTPDGYPLVFDAPNNVWYQVNPDGSYTPYYQVP